MYKIILVEDEPAAAENICDIIRLYCPRFAIAAIGDNGKAGLELAQRHKPDLLLTDIRMPVMNGLELIIKLHEEMPWIKTIILSGYQDFEYARTALQHGAADYLLKPISPLALQTTLDQIIPAINDSIVHERLSLLRRLLNNDIPNREILKNHFTAPKYILAISRKNGLPGRFCRTLFAQTHGVIDGETTGIFGRDDMESLHILPGVSAFSRKSLEEINWLHRDIPGYTTTVVRNKPFAIEELPEIIKTMYNSLDSRLVIGKNQIISVDAANSKQTADSLTGKYHSDSEIKQLLMFYTTENKPEHIRTLLLDQLKKWEAEEQPQLYVEGSVRLFFEQLCPETCHARDEGFEFMIDDAFFYAASYEELRESILFILEKLLPCPQNIISKVDTPEFFELIREYISAHLAEPLSLQSLCRHFGVSQTYVSRLFRKYTGLSFLNYVTSLRIEKAKAYLSNRDTLIKDAAAMAGFSDQFYFSRVFRSVTGLSPSEYVRTHSYS